MSLRLVASITRKSDVSKAVLHPVPSVAKALRVLAALVVPVTLALMAPMKALRLKVILPLLSVVACGTRSTRGKIFIYSYYGNTGINVARPYIIII